MKKLFVAITLVAIFGMLISSCKSVEKCPAYSKIELEQSDSTNPV
jgi:hypothetical protein